MIKLTKLNNDTIVINSQQIQSIEVIPESKIVLMNKEFYVVKESTDEILDKILAFDSMLASRSRKIVLETVDEN